jgi:hypothetical protein
MAIQLQGNSGAVAEVGAILRSLNITPKALEYGSLGHYRTAVRIVGTSVQAANSRLFEIRNTAANLIIPTCINVSVAQIAAGTAQENSVDLFKCTAFTAVDTTNTVTPTSSAMKTTGMAAYPGGAAVRHLTLAGAAAGMTGGTLTKDANALATFPYFVNTAVPTTPNAVWGPFDMLANIAGYAKHPLVLAQNEGFEIENRVLNVTTFGICFYIDVSWAEVPTTVY